MKNCIRISTLFLSTALVSQPHTVFALVPSERLTESNLSAQITSPFASRDLIDEVWQIVDRSYLDSTFNGQDWQAIRRQVLQQSYSSQEELYQAIREMLSRLGDPLTRFISPEEFRSMQFDSNVASVGLTIQRNQQTNELQIIAPIEGTPAYRAGILPGDVLVTIDGTNVQNAAPYEAVNLLRGNAGTSSTVTVRRAQQEIPFRLTRERVEIVSVRYAKQDTRIGTVGYIRFNRFDSKAAELMRLAIQNLESQDVKGYILDLRSNPGGLFYVVIDIARMWLNEGAIVSIQFRDRTEENVANQTALTDKPLVVLVDGGTGSGSEILAGALQQNRRARLVGTPTIGANSIQSVRQLTDGSGLAVTVTKWSLSDGQDIANVGLTPNVRSDLTQAQQQDLAQRSLIGTPDDLQYEAALSALATLTEPVP